MEEECVDKGNSKTDHFIPKANNHVVIKPLSSQDQLQNVDNGEKEKCGKREPNWMHVWPQVLASCIALGTTIQAGINLSFSSVLLPQLEDDKFNLTKSEASWIASVVTIGTPAGALIVGPVMDLIGRKSTCVLSNIPVLLSWILTYTTKQSIWPLYVARAFAGFGAGMSTVALVYTAEISHSLYRPMLLCLNSVFVAFGIMMTNVLGAYITWKTMALLFGLLSIFSFSLCLVLPESPNWLITFTPSESRMERALEELQKLNRPTWLYQEECKKLKELFNERKNSLTCQDKSSTLVKVWNNRTVLLKISVISPLLVLIVLFLLQQLSGVYVIIFYSVTIFEKIILIDKYTCTVLLGILRFIMSIIAAALSRIYGRRPLMIVSSLGMAMSCGLAAAILSISGGDKFRVLTGSNSTENANNTLNNINDTLNSNLTSYSGGVHPDIDAYNAVTLIAVALILLFMCFGAIGHLVIPWTLISELLPNKARAIGSGFMIFCAYVLMFLTVKTFLPLLDLVGISNILFFYALMCFLTAPFTYFFIPETLGKTFKEISKSFKRSNR